MKKKVIKKQPELFSDLPSKKMFYEILNKKPVKQKATISNWTWKPSENIQFERVIGTPSEDCPF